MPQHVVVVEYRPEWPLAYEKEKERIQKILKENCLALWHIGSTSVPGLAAKPVIDILGAVRSLEEVDAVSEAFVQAGYACMGEFGIAGRRYFRKGGEERTHQIHLFCGDDWDSLHRHLAFRDFMRAHVKEREAYGELKKKLAEQHPWDIEAYCDGKDEFVKEMERRALAEYDGAWDRLYLAARRIQYPRKISPLMEAGTVAAALLTEAGHVYAGVCIDTACSMGMCAERNAMAQMISQGESRVAKIAALMPDGRAVMPCGVCREFMMQLGEGAENIEILKDYETGQTVRLKELMPHWWSGA